MSQTTMVAQHDKYQDRGPVTIINWKSKNDSRSQNGTLYYQQNNSINSKLLKQDRMLQRATFRESSGLFTLKELSHSLHILKRGGGREGGGAQGYFSDTVIWCFFVPCQS